MFCTTLLLLFLAWSAVPAAAQSQWQWANPLPNGNFTTGLIWDGNRFVGVDDAGSVNISADGVVWSHFASGSPALLRVAAGNTGYVAVGFSGEIRTSPDAINWTPQISGTQETLWAVCFADSQFVAVGGTWNGDPDSGDALILTSPDGIVWTARTVPDGITAQLFALTWDGHQFVAVGFYGTIVTSPDGVAWTKQISGTNDNLDSIAWSGSAFVAAGQAGTILASSDGSAWTVGLANIAPELDNVIWTMGHFVAIGANGLIVTSPDGGAWTMQKSGTDDELSAIAASPSAIVAMGFTGTVVKSRTAIDWTTTSVELTPETLTGVVWNGTEFVSTGDGGSVLVSIDGESWDVLPVFLPLIANSIAWGGSQFVVVGDGGQIATSADAQTWTLQESGTTANLRGVAWGDSQFVAVGQSPGSLMTGPGSAVILTSTDGVTWVAETSHSVAGDAINAVVWSGSQFVGVGSGPMPVFTSSDGHRWMRTQVLPGTSGPALFSIAWSGSLFVAVGNPGEIPVDPRVIATSPNGTDWTFQPAPADVFYATGLTGVVWSGKRFVAVGGFGIELSSFDGHAWFSDSTLSVAQFTSIATSGNRCVAVGLEGAIMDNQSCDVDRVFGDGFETRVRQLSTLQKISER